MCFIRLSVSPKSFRIITQSEIHTHRALEYFMIERWKVNLPVWQHPMLISHAAILQRVLSASVTVDKQLISSIGKGILVFAAVAPHDTEKEVDALAAKVLKMRLWDDDNGGRVCIGSDLCYHRSLECRYPLLFSHRLSNYYESGKWMCKISVERYCVVSVS